MEPLNHHNPEYVTWKYEEMLFALLGGIRIEGLPHWRKCSLSQSLNYKRTVYGIT